MTFSENPARSNKSGHLYTKGSKDVDGSIRLSINPFTAIARIEKRENGIWRPASFEVDSSSVWVGPSVGIGGAGSHIITENPDGLFHLFAHNNFDGKLTTHDAKIIDAYQHTVRDVGMSDDSGEWTGKIYSFNFLLDFHVLLKRAYFKTGAVAASSSICLEVWQGIDDTGPRIFTKDYPGTSFIVNSEIIVDATGFVEIKKDIAYFIRLSSDNDFSLKTSADLVSPWFAGDTSLVREDNMLQAIPYEDGETYNQDQWAIQGKKIYICNVTGIQTGTFASNSDKWDALGAGSSGDMQKSVYDPSTKNSDAFSMGNMDETATKKVLTNTERSEISVNTAKNSYPSADSTKLAGIESGAEVNQSDAEVKSQYEANANTNAFVDAEKSKLAGIEPNAEVNQDDSEIKSQYEANTNTNAFTDSEKSKLSGLESSKWLGSFTSLSALETAHPNSGPGFYGDVDLGVGQDVTRYIWDDDDSQYVQQLGEASELTDAQIKTKYESNPDTNAFTDSDESKLDGIQAGAQVNQSNSQIKTQYEANPDTNAFQDAEKTKLSGIETLAEVNQSNSEIKTQYESNSDTNAFTNSEKTKLSGIEPGAEANVQSDWNQSDSEADDYIKNKPAIGGLTSFEAKASNTITTMSTTDVLATGMSLIPGAGDYLIWFSTVLENSDDETTYVSIYVNGVKDDASERRWENEGSIPNTPATVATNGRALSLEAGQAIEIKWRTTNNTATMHQRTLTILKIN